MKICEDCIKNDVCKFKSKVEKYEEEAKLPEPLESNVGCKYKRSEPSNWHYTTIPDCDSGTVSIPSIWTTTTEPCDCTTTTCN